MCCIFCLLRYININRIVVDRFVFELIKDLYVIKKEVVFVYLKNVLKLYVFYFCIYCIIKDSLY